MNKKQNQTSVSNAKSHCFGRLALIPLFVVITWSVFLQNVNAITLDNNYYTLDDRIYSTSDGFNYIILFDVNSGEQIFSTPSYFNGQDLTATNVPGQYSYVETYGLNCVGNNLSYSDCLASDDFMDEAQFTILPPGGTAPSMLMGRAPISNASYPPAVTIISPVKGSVFSHTGTIAYGAVDPNDVGQPYFKQNAGLGPNPVSLFYSDKLGDNMYTMVDPGLKSPIAAGLTASSSYLWTTTGLVPGDWYRIIADAVDMEGLIGEAVSDAFTVDYNPPVFTVKADPPAVRRGTVNISVDSSKDLPAPPKVTVTQTGAHPVAVEVTGSGSHFTGNYVVVTGYDGTARISVSGIDAAGNMSTTTVSGGTFSVGVNPPTIPVIASPSVKSAVADDHIDVTGTVRNDTTAILEANGQKVAEATPDDSGAFTFKGVALDKTDNHGLNYLSVSSRDAFGVVGPSADIQVKWNVPPTVALVKPAPDEVVSDQEDIAANGADANGDALYYTFQIQPGRNPVESAWTSIGDELPGSGFVWNATEVDDGEYSMHVIADDGWAKATSTPVRFTVMNTVPYFRFVDGRQTVTRGARTTITGSVHTSNNLGVRPNISSASYSTDKGVHWIPLKLNDTFGALSDRQFTLALPIMKEGTYPILWRVTDSRGTVGNAVHPVIIDRTAPVAPVVTSNQDGDILTRSDDQNTIAPGLQTDIAGNAEPGSIVTLSYDGATTTVRTLASGSFDFGGVTFSARGAHKLMLTASDAAGNTSRPTSLTLVYDNPPIITLLNPEPFHGLSGNADIKWSIKGGDSGQVGATTVSYHRYGAAWKTIATNVDANGDVPFDVTGLPEANDYELRIATSDGIMPVSLTASFSVDDTAPVVQSLTADTKTASSSIGLSASGVATDNVSGVEYVEFSISPQNGTVQSSASQATTSDNSWYRALITKGFMSIRATYSIRYPMALDDGDYVLSARAIDAAGNISQPLSRDIRIDRTAPRIGSFFLEASGVRLPPDDMGAVSIPAHSPATFGITLESDVASSSLSVGGQVFPLTLDISTGVWMASIPADTATGTSRLALTAIDQNGNAVTDQTIGSLTAIGRGMVSAKASNGALSPVSGAHIRVLKFNDSTQSYDAYVDGEGVPIAADTDQSGQYDLALPQGEYRLVVTAPGMKTVTQGVSLDRSGYAEPAIETEPISGIGQWLQTFLGWFSS